MVGSEPQERRNIVNTALRTYVRSMSERHLVKFLWPKIFLNNESRPQIVGK